MAIPNQPGLVYAWHWSTRPDLHKIGFTRHVDDRRWAEGGLEAHLPPGILGEQVFTAALIANARECRRVESLIHDTLAEFRYERPGSGTRRGQPSEWFQTTPQTIRGTFDVTHVTLTTSLVLLYDWCR